MTIYIRRILTVEAVSATTLPQDGEAEKNVPHAPLDAIIIATTVEAEKEDKLLRR